MTMIAAPAKALLTVQQKDGKIYSPVRKMWLSETPEERVRQNYLLILVNDYGYSLAQIKEEVNTTGRGSAARADFILWRTAQDKDDDKSPFIVVECKSDNVTITEKDYQQGEDYARRVDAPFFVTHNSRETKYWRVLKDRMPGYREEVANIPEAGDTDERIRDLMSAQKTFNDRDFAKLLHDCHDIIRNREHKDPAAAFDEMAKMLFVKVDQERRMRSRRARENRFSMEFMDQQQEITGDALGSLFKTTKEDYKGDKIFHADDQINLKFNTAREIVKRLEKYNLSDTSEDIKGIAFERFLGRTFRGEIGQFFTPRTIVDFMIEMVDPHEGDVICDPASGSGGFLIRFFEIVREKILADADQEYRAFEEGLDAQDLSEDAKAKRLLAEYERLQKSLDQRVQGSRLWKLANRCIYGTDANDRMARTSKMNMIMHGDGHGGVHHHNGFLNVNGIFEGRFDIILTNPPFGANVENSDLIRPEDLELDDEDLRRYEQAYGDAYTAARARVEAKKGEPITSLFTLPRGGKDSKIKTEILFLERCLDLLKPDGRLGIVLPEGIFNNPSLAYVREFCEDRAFLRAVVSLPQETFTASGASVKASLLFLQKFTDAEQGEFDAKNAAARAETQAKYQPEIDAETARLIASLAEVRAAGDKGQVALLAKERRDFERAIAEKITQEARALLGERFAYPIFLYEAEKVGITATGDEDSNELGPRRDALPAGVSQTCLEVYREYRQNPEAFLMGEQAIGEDLKPEDLEENLSGESAEDE